MKPKFAAPPLINATYVDIVCKGVLRSRINWQGRVMCCVRSTSPIRIVWYIIAFSPSWRSMALDSELYVHYILIFIKHLLVFLSNLLLMLYCYESVLVDVQRGNQGRTVCCGSISKM